MYNKADTHMHTTCSDGLMSPEATIDYIVQQTDLRVVAITDHDTAEGGLIAREYGQKYADRLDIIVGQEVTTDEGDVIGLFIHSTMPMFKTAIEAIEAIQAQGGLAVAAHPFSRPFTFNQMHGVTTKIFDLPFDAVEVCNGFPTNLICNPATAWLNRYRGQQLPELGGSDSHVAYTIGQTYTWFKGETAADFRQAVERGQVKAGGVCWSPLSVARTVSKLIQHGGLPRYKQDEDHKVQAEISRR